MNDKGSAVERLDALLTALEDEVMRSGESYDNDVEPLRTQIATAIKQRVGVGSSKAAALKRTEDGKVGVVELLARWAGITRDGARRTSLPARVRMAFSGERDQPEDGRGEPEESDHDT